MFHIDYEVNWHDKIDLSVLWKSTYCWLLSSLFILLHVQAIGSGASPVQNPRQAAYEGRVQAMNYSTNSSNKEAAEALKAMLVQINC